MIPASKLHDLLAYDDQTGILTWKSRPRELFKTHRAFVQWNQRYVGEAAGTLKNDSGYIIVSIHKQHERAHRVIWAMCTGEWPEISLDHINGCRTDNRISNLRLATQSENAKNMRLMSSNKTGFHGITKAPHGKYRAKGYASDVQHHLGYFDTLEEAVAARKEFELSFGFHPNHGRAAQERVVA
jgi:hypothetical protein